MRVMLCSLERTRVGLFAHTIGDRGKRGGEEGERVDREREKDKGNEREGREG